MNSKTKIIVAVALTIGGISSNCTGATSITLQEHTVARSSVVRLGDVATIGVTDRSQTLQLATVPLLPAPAPGTERYLLKREIADLLAAHGLNLKEIEFAGADRVAIFAPSESAVIQSKMSADGDNITALNHHAALLSGATGASATSKLDAARANELRDEMCRLITDYVDVNTGQPGSCHVECNVDERYLTMLSVKTSQPTCHGGREPLTGRQRFFLSFTTPQGKVELPIYANVVANAVPVVVAIRPIARGDVITASQIDMRPVENVPRPTDRRAACDSIENIVGMQARQAIPAGDVVFTDQLQPPTLVKRNDIVTVTSQSGRIRVRTTARARQDGAQGDLIQVDAIDTRERYDVRVTGPRDTAVCVVAETASPQPQKVFQAIRPTRAF
jgi:flagella basal body P-ring formation protein FlgA